MLIDPIVFAPDWCPPVFKILANNDTKNAPGHQGGILIPKDIRGYFPDLAGLVTPQRPTLDRRITADLFDGIEQIGTVSTRYQYQTWGAERSPESRLTDQLSGLMYRAVGDDVMVFVRSASDPDHYRLVLVGSSSPDFCAVMTSAGGKRWGSLRCPV